MDAPTSSEESQKGKDHGTIITQGEYACEVLTTAGNSIILSHGALKSVGKSTILSHGALKSMQSEFST